MGRNSEEEFTRFVHERGDVLLRVAQALAGDRYAAEDLLQNALAKAYARWPRIRGDAEPYVRQILYHDQVSLWRRRGRRSEVTVAEVPERPAVTAGQLDHDTAVRMLLRDALRKLPPRQRAVLVLRYLEDQTVEQTAAMLGCRPGTVASQASRALAKLRDLVPEFAELAPATGRRGLTGEDGTPGGDRTPGGSNGDDPAAGGGPALVRQPGWVDRHGDRTTAAERDRAEVYG